VSIGGARGRLRGLAPRGNGLGAGSGGAGGAPPALLELAHRGQAPLLCDGGAADPPHVAAIIPSFRRGSGGHATIVNLLRGLRELGHPVSVWLEDTDGRHAREPETLTRRSFGEFFGAEGIPLQTGFADWRGADIVLATGWQTVYRALLLEGTRARAYLVQDHEPDFYATSAESLWAAQTYRQGMLCIAASPWLAGLLRERYSASASHLDLAVEHSVYRPSGAHRHHGRVLFYARAVTPRRAVPLGLAALAELARRRPGVEIALYGEDRPLEVAFAHRNLGVVAARELAEQYSQATVGMVLSLTNPSLVNLEMMACGLPCVELASEPMLASFGAAGPLELAAPEPLALAGALQALLDDPERRAQRSREGLQLLAARTWRGAAAQLQEGLAAALAQAQRR
jgi:glycosyltransferase involved in cell wall biosynthesis